MNTQYEDLLRKIMEQGIDKSDRTGTGTRSLFGQQMRFNLAWEGFPLITTKRVHFKSVAEELFWMLSGSTNVKDLQARGVTIWDEWARPDGELGPVYGKQWRSWDNYDHIDGYEYGLGNPIDQITQVIESIKTNPDSRRHIVSAWNVAEIDEMALPPCHLLFQFYVRGDYLDLQLYQRSADMFLGVPFNIASYALLLELVAKQTQYEPGEFVWTGGDCHIYYNHMNQVDEQLSREPRQFPELLIADEFDLFNMTAKDVGLYDYDPHPAIKGDVAV